MLKGKHVGRTVSRVKAEAERFKDINGDPHDKEDDNRAGFDLGLNALVSTTGSRKGFDDKSFQDECGLQPQRSKTLNCTFFPADFRGETKKPGTEADAATGISALLTAASMDMPIEESIAGKSQSCRICGSTPGGEKCSCNYDRNTITTYIKQWVGMQPNYQVNDEPGKSRCRVKRRNASGRAYWTEVCCSTNCAMWY